MPYTVVDVAQVPPSSEYHPASSPWDRRLDDALAISAFGLYQVELPPGAETVAHDHRDDRSEDAYVVVSGGGWLVVDDDEVELAAGRAASVAPGAVRRIRAGADGCTFVAVCAAERRPRP